MRILLTCLLLSTAVMANPTATPQQCQTSQTPTTYIEGCLSYSSDGLCQQCQYNYKLSNSRCYYSPKVSSDCCLEFNGDSKCSKCAYGLQSCPSSGICKDIKITGCLQKDNQGCKQCAQNYDLVQGRCVSSVSKCTQYDSEDNCIACGGSTTLRHGTCVPKITVQPIPNCKAQNQYGCGVCEPGYRIDSKGNCQPGVTGCIIHNYDGTCNKCLSPFYDIYDGRCAVVGCKKYSQGSCESCDSSLGFIPHNGRCVIKGCIYFTNKGCSLCSNKLIAGSWGCRQPEGKVCLICKSDQYKGKDGQCQKKDVHCINYQSGSCTQCCQSFFLDLNAYCKPIRPGCIYQQGVCSACQPPFQYSNGQCLIQGCIQYNNKGCLACDSRLSLFDNICGLPNCKTINNYKCQQCLPGYQIDCNDRCVLVDPNCLKKNSKNVCLKCKQGFRLDENGVCSTHKFGCNYVDGRCTSCRSPFMYIPETESCEIDGCIDYFIGGCQKCKRQDGYIMLYNTCKLPNCLISNNGKCVQCDPDYVFRSDGKCVSKDEFCQKMDQYGTCIKCMSSYFYSQKLQRCVKKSPGCHYDDQDNCCSCDKPFTYEPGRCIIKGCLRFDQNGCYECNYPYSVTEDKTCAIAHCTSYSQNGRCASCQDGYALSNKFKCEIQDKHCKQYNSHRTACIQCIKGYRIDPNGKCQYADQHCSYFDETGFCINCDRLYFLNFYGKCQLRDPQCLVYTNGLCSVCRDYFFPKGGVCMANMAGCKQQLKYGQCKYCEKGYRLTNGNCRARITRFNWNSIDMDFGDDSDSCSKEESKSVFTVGVNSKLNLVPILSNKQGKIFFTSSSLNGASFELSAKGTNGWSPSGDCTGQHVGLKTASLQTFYAVDIKQLSGSNLKSFSIEYSMDGKEFVRVQDFSFESVSSGSISTFYFKPVYAKFIRIVVKEGRPNIRFEFYVSSNIQQNQPEDQQNTYIGKTVVSTIDGVEQGGISTCKTGGLCWAGVQSCEPRKIQGFQLVYQNDCSDRVSEVKVEYSTDGLTFTCYNNCVPIPLSNNGFTFPSPFLAQKVHIHFTKYSGKPSFGVKFDF